ncbi:hypothetical protein [Azohydromonas aeria]|uniref:hypothetical protein n=1 Tax=Azohydromonas aeria TaxID=2590212 RepID=UPI0012FAE1A2|nr:hypothetical protein [Azohydromonas aeria]
MAVLSFDGFERFLDAASQRHDAIVLTCINPKIETFELLLSIPSNMTAPSAGPVGASGPGQRPPCSASMSAKSAWMGDSTPGVMPGPACPDQRQRCADRMDPFFNILFQAPTKPGVFSSLAL